MTSDPHYRKTSLIDDGWEDVDIKPAVDLIPDEFQRDSNKNILVEIIFSQRDQEAIDFKDLLIKLDYTVSETDYDGKGLDKSPPTRDWLTKVQDKILTNKFDGLMMVFAKVSYKSEDMKKIWSMFTAPNCPTLKDKPKIFIFQILKRMVADVDSILTRRNWSAKYDTPAEADIAVIYDKYDSDSMDFFTLLSRNITQHGETENLTTIISICGVNKIYQPMIMSTLTGKFYFLLHEHRGHHHKLHTKSDQVIEHMKSIKWHVSNVHDTQKEQKKPGVIKRFVKRISSMRRSRDDNKVEKNDNLAFSNANASTAVDNLGSGPSTSAELIEKTSEEETKVKEQRNISLVSTFKSTRKSSTSYTAEGHQTAGTSRSRIARSDQFTQVVSSSSVGSSTSRPSTNILPVSLKTKGPQKK